MGRRSCHGILSTQGGGHVGSHPRHARLRQAIRRGVQRVEVRLWGRSRPGGTPGGRRPVAPRHRALAAYERELIGLVQALEALPMGAPLPRQDGPLQSEIPPRPAPRHDTATALGRQALGLRLHSGVPLGRNKRRRRALSRCDNKGELLATSAPRFDFIERLRHAQATDPALVAIHDELRAGSRAAPWTITDGMVAMEGGLYIPPASPLLGRGPRRRP